MLFAFSWRCHAKVCVTIQENLAIYDHEGCQGVERILPGGQQGRCPLRCSLPAEERTISLATIAAATKLEADGVEFLLMKALSLHLIEGLVDQVAGTVQARPPAPASVPGAILP